MPTLTATEARSNLYRLIDEAASSHEPIIIKGKRGSAVLISEDDWRAIQETMYLLNIPGMRESIREGLATPIEECTRELDTKQAQKDAKKLSAAGLRPKAEKLIAILRENPYTTPPPFEKLLGDLSGAFSRRINIQHRLVYQILDDEKVVKVIRMWTHYE